MTLAWRPRTPHSHNCRRTIQGDADTALCKSQLTRQHVKMMQSRQLARPEIEADNVCQIAPAKSGVQAKQRRLAGSDGPDILASARFRLLQSFRDGTEIDALAHRPGGVDERQSCPVVPFLPQVVGMGEP